MEHILTDCGMIEDAVEEALTAIKEIRSERAEATVEAREMGYEDDGEQHSGRWVTRTMER